MILFGYKEVTPKAVPSVLYVGHDGAAMVAAYEKNKAQFVRIEKSVNPPTIRLRTEPATQQPKPAGKPKGATVPKPADQDKPCQVSG